MVYLSNIFIIVGIIFLHEKIILCSNAYSIKSYNVFDVLSEEGMEAETTPASPRKGQIAILPITEFSVQLI